MKDILTDSELAFLASQGLGPDDVFDARPYSQAVWFRLIEKHDKTIAYGGRCRKAGHRLKTRRGHCVQCDPKKLAFVARYSAEQYVYIAGSLEAKLLKIGTCVDLNQRLNQICFERHGGASDWIILSWTHVERAGEFEHRALTQLSAHAVSAPYWKNGELQMSTELLRCSFSKAYDVIAQMRDAAALARPWRSPQRMNYEFT